MAMDPHSRLAQFNQRPPKSGPYIPTSRFMEPSPKPKLDYLPKRSPSTGKSPSNPSLLTPRPIATNSRVKNDEKFRKDMYLSFINNALQQKANGNSQPFDDLVKQFNPKRITEDGAPVAAQLRLWMLALSHVVSRLERHHSPLVEAIVNMPWTIMDSAFVKSYTVFMGMLLSARPEYLSIVLSTVAQGFTHQSGLQTLDGTPEGSSGPLTRRVVYDRLHYLLRHILSLIPTLPSTLEPLLVRNFPHKRQNQVAQATYIRNLLTVTEYCPELADRLLATIVDRAIQIDVEIQVELEELEDDESPQDTGDVFELDPFDTIVGQDGDESESDNGDDDEDGENLDDLSSDGEEMDEEVDISTNVHHIQDMVKKLDTILKLVFDHFHRTHFTPVLPPTTPTISSRPSAPSSTSTTPDPPRPPSPSTIESLRRSQFHTLLSIFDRTIIRTFKSRYTQFLLFWYSSLDPEYADLFQGLLVSKALLEEDQPAVTRAAAASYIASFVSRASFVNRDGARRVIGVLCNFLKSHLDAYDVMVQAGVTTVPGMTHHSVFYAVAQAVFLIFCFRWRDFLEEQDQDEKEADVFSGSGKVQKKWMLELNVVQRVVTSPLNPLKICSSNVVMQFARVAHATDFIYCYSILEFNKRSDYANSHLNSSPPRQGSVSVNPAILDDSIHTELNTFFPFDPYKLPKSGSYIQSVYREWSAVAIDDEEDEHEDDEENECDGARGGCYDYMDIPSTKSTQDKDADAEGLGASFDGMSISPMRPALVAAMS